MKKFLFTVCFLSATSLWASSNDSNLQSIIPIPWISSTEVLKLNPSDQSTLLRQLKATCRLNDSNTECSKQSKVLKRSLKAAPINPQSWDSQSAFFQRSCDAGQSRTDCYQTYQGLNDTRQSVGLAQPEGTRAPVEILREAPSPLSAAAVSDSDEASAQNAKCRVNLMTEGLRCKINDPNTALVSYQDTYDYFCTKKTAPRDFADQVQQTLTHYKKCLELNSKRSSAEDRSWFKASLERLNLDLIPNANTCLNELQKGQNFNRKKIGSIQMRTDSVQIQTSKENMITQKSYLGATLDSRKTSLCQFQLNMSVDGRRAGSAPANGNK